MSRGNTLQDMINEKLKKIYPTEMFKREELELELVNRPDVKCKKCGSNKIFCELKQLRSADEPMTELYKCLNCGYRWRND